jgi:hypothetical protein
MKVFSKKRLYEGIGSTALFYYIAAVWNTFDKGALHFLFEGNTIRVLTGPIFFVILYAIIRLWQDTYFINRKNKKQRHFPL